MKELKAIYEAIDSGSLCITGGNCPQFKEIYKHTWDFGNPYYEIRLYDRETQFMTDDISTYAISVEGAMKSRSDMTSKGLPVVEMFESSIRIEAIEVDVPILLSKSLASYKADGISVVSIDNPDNPDVSYMKDSLFNESNEYDNDENLVAVFRFLMLELAVMYRNKLAIDNCFLCFTASEGPIKYKTSLMFEGTRYMGTGDDRDDVELANSIGSILKALIVTENSNNSVKREWSDELSYRLYELVKSIV